MKEGYEMVQKLNQLEKESIEIENAKKTNSESSAQNSTSTSEN